MRQLGEKKVLERAYNANPFFSMKKSLILTGIYNSQNDRIWAVNREKANRRGGKKSKESFHKK